MPPLGIEPETHSSQPTSLTIKAHPQVPGGKTKRNQTMSVAVQS